MSAWPSTRARPVLAALLRIGWRIKRETGSHKTLVREGSPDYVFAFHDSVEIGPKMLARSEHPLPRAPDARSFCEAALRVKPSQGRLAFHRYVTSQHTARDRACFCMRSRSGEAYLPGAEGDSEEREALN